MSQLVFSCLLKSKDGGQTFYEVLPGEFRQFKEKLRFNSKCVQVDRIPNGPIVGAMAEMASDSTESISYIKLYGNCSQYNSLKPRWIEANLRPQHVLSNFSIAKDLILSKLIADRAKGPSKCFMIIDRKMGGFYVDYNLFPMFINRHHDIVTNWMWIEYVNFVMQLFLLSSKNNPLIQYEVMLEYSEQQIDVPSDISYSIRFMAESDENKWLIQKLFHHLKLFSLNGPLDPFQYYICSGNISDMSNTLCEIRRLNLELNILHDMLKSNDVILLDVRTEINLKWDNILALANQFGDKVQSYSSNTVKEFGRNEGEQLVNNSKLDYSKTNREAGGSSVKKNEKRFGKAKHRSENPLVNDDGFNDKLSVANKKLDDSKHSDASSSASERKGPAKKNTALAECKDLSEWDNEPVTNSKQSFRNSKQSAFGKCKDPADWASEEPSTSKQVKSSQKNSVNEPATNSKQSFGQNSKYSAFGKCKDPADWASEEPSTSKQVKSSQKNSANEPATNSKQSFGQNSKYSAFGKCKDPADWASEEPSTSKQMKSSQKNSANAPATNSKQSFGQNSKQFAIGECNSVEKQKSSQMPQNEGGGNAEKAEDVSSDSESFISLPDMDLSHTSPKKIDRELAGKKRERFLEYQNSKNYKYLIITGMLFDPEDDLVLAVEELFREVLQLQIKVKQVIRVGGLNDNMVRVAFNHFEDRDSVLVMSRDILPFLKSRVVIREDRYEKPFFRCSRGYRNY